MFNNIKIAGIFILIVINISFSLYGQSDNNASSLIPSIPTSPQAEAFKRYGEYSINYSTGIPDISIPLYEINHRGYILPLALKYYPQALKPSNNYDVYGLGWGLSINSCISRSIESVPDELNNFKLDTHVFGNTLMSYEPNYSFFKLNFEFDRFHATLPNGIGFDFSIESDKNGNLNYLISGNNSVKICAHAYNSKIDSFTVIDNSGIKYTFSEGDAPNLKYALSEFNRTNVSWHLTRIDLPNSTEPIKFNYDYSIDDTNVAGFQDPALKITSEKKLALSSDSTRYHTEHIIRSEYIDNLQADSYKMKLLTSISYGTTKSIVLTYQNIDKTRHNYVKKIQINDVASLEVNLAMTETAMGGLPTLQHLKIARLDSVIIKNTKTSDKPQVYKCDYLYMSDTFWGIDHWGFLNRRGYHENILRNVANFNIFVEFDTGKNFPGLTSISKTSEDVSPYNKLKISRDNNDFRQPSGPSDHGVLSRLTYPTGGHTDFEFENHRFLTSTDSDGNYIYNPLKKHEALASGFRIKKITNYESDGKIAEVKNFRYGKTYAEAKGENVNFSASANITPNLHTGVGEAVVDPNIVTYMIYTSYWVALNSGTGSLPIRNMILGLDENGEHKPFLNPFIYNTMPFSRNAEYYWECVFSPANFRRLVNGRPPVIYPEVTVYYGEIGENGAYTPQNTIGKTVYKYDIYDYEDGNTVFFESVKSYENSLWYEPKSYLYNNLNEKIDYRFDGQNYKIIHKEISDWGAVYYNMQLNYQYANTWPLGYYVNTGITLNDYFLPKYVYYGSALLQSQNTTTYDLSGDSIVLSESFTYYNNFLLRQKSVLNSNGQYVADEYFYPEIKTSGTPDVIKTMVNNNMLTPIVNKVTKTRNSMYANWKDISGYKIDYKEFNSENTTFIMPEKMYELEDESYELKTEILSYTKHGNPQEAVTNDNIHTVYLWSYNYQYLIAEIKHATLYQVSNAVQSVFGTSIEGLASNANPDITMLKNLKNDANLKNAYVTTFTYGPWSKVISITDPANKTVYFDYDGFGRLTESYYFENNDTSKKRKIESQEYNFRE